MPHHRSRPTHRKARNPRASWLVLGGPTATSVLHHGQRALLIPVKAGDHRSRYSTGQRLAVKTYVPGPTEAHVILTGVSGIRETFRLGDVDYATARELGHVRLDHFRCAWVEDNDHDWMARVEVPTDEQLMERFESRWDQKLAWLLRFRIDPTAPPRMLAAAPSSYDPSKENAEGRDEDRGYTTVDSRSARDELPALTDDEWNRHVGSRSAFREHARLRAEKAEREARSLDERIERAEKEARAKGYSLRSEMWVLKGHLRDGKPEKARQQMERIERRVFPMAA